MQGTLELSATLVKEDSAKKKTTCHVLPFEPPYHIRNVVGVSQ